MSVHTWFSEEECYLQVQEWISELTYNIQEGGEYSSQIEMAAPDTMLGFLAPKQVLSKKIATTL